MSISEASLLISQKELKPTELVEAHLNRIEKTNGKLNAFVNVMRPRVRSAVADYEKSGA